MSSRLLSQCIQRKIDPIYRETVRNIADQANDFGYFCSSIDYLAWMGECSTRTIKRHLVQLRKIGALVKVKDSGFHRPTTYVLDLDVFPDKPPFIPKGDMLDTKDLHEGIFVPHPKGDTLTPETIKRLTPEEIKKSTEFSFGSIVKASAAAKNAAALTSVDWGEIAKPAPGGTESPIQAEDFVILPEQEAYDPFAGIGEPLSEIPEPAVPSKLPQETRRTIIKVVSDAEQNGVQLFKTSADKNSFRIEWLDEVAPLIRDLFGYSSTTRNCYSVANQLLKGTKRPKLNDKPVPLMDIVHALDRLNESQEARKWKNNPRVNEFMVPGWIENELARAPETEGNGAFLMWSQP